MKKLLLILLCVPLIGFGQTFSDGFPEGYLEPDVTMDWVDTAGGLYFFCPIGWNDDGAIAYRIMYELNEGPGYYYDKILIQFSGSGWGSDDTDIIDELILYEGVGEGEDFDYDWGKKYSLINNFLFKWGVFESF